MGKYARLGGNCTNVVPVGLFRSAARPLRGTALITGGSSGFGLAFARALAQRGLNIVLVARNEERLAAAAEQVRAFGVNCSILPADVSTEAGRALVAERLDDDAAPITVFVNNAGMGIHHKLATRDFAPLREALELMVVAVYELGGIAADAMKKRGNGLIITTGSVSGMVPMGFYSALKSFVRTWSDSLAAELAGTGVTALAFLPGWTRTEHHERAGITTSNLPDWIWLDADETVEECLRGAERGKTAVVPSKRFKAISFLAQHAPRGAVTSVTSKIRKGRG